MVSYIYGIVHRETGKYFYIGQTTRPIKVRQAEHFKQIEAHVHKIKQLNTYKVEDLDFEILCKVETQNSLVLATLENFYNSLLHPYNRCVVSGFRGQSVILKREDNKELCEDIIELIKKYY